MSYHKKGMKEKTKTQETIDHYDRVARDLIRRYESDHPGATLEESPVDVCRGIVDTRWPRLSKASKRLYRAALVSMMSRLGHDDAARFMSGVSTDTNGDDRKDRHVRAKKLPPDYIDMIAEHLNLDRTSDRVIFSMLYAGAISGLRPGEWRNARFVEVDGGRHILVVSNSKNTNGRAHGSERTITFHDLDEDQSGVIDSLITEISRLSNDEYTAMMNHIKVRLSRITAKVWPNASARPTLYSGRHQFSADAKKAGVDEVALAAIMGHKSPDAARRFYGIRRNGGSGYGVTVTADPDDMSRVTQVEDGRDLDSVDHQINRRR